MREGPYHYRRLGYLTDRQGNVLDLIRDDGAALLRVKKPATIWTPKDTTNQGHLYNVDGSWSDVGPFTPPSPVSTRRRPTASSTPGGSWTV